VLTQEAAAQTPQIQIWPIDRLIFYARNPRKNDAVVDRMCSSIREFGFKIPVLARSDGEVVDGHLRLKAAQKLRITEVPVILCDEWSAAQVKAFRLMVNRSVTWAQWDDELLALELQELNEAEFDLSLTGFDPKEIDDQFRSDRRGAPEGSSMNRSLPLRNRGGRNSAAKRASRCARTVPSFVRLACRVAAVASRPRVGHRWASVGPRSPAWRRLSLTAKAAVSWAYQVPDGDGRNVRGFWEEGTSIEE
jgi:hypothetical protein